ncbi:MAG: M56 family metallopeptidase [Bacteroidales bacterium]|nr:M56 family metallopeptidase [Bacteroidales bacterium]
MNELILYIIKSTLYLSVFQSFYLLVMRKTTFFRLNRTVFLAGTFICLLLPFIRIRMPSGSDIITPMAIIEEAISAGPMTLQAAVVGAEESINWTKLIITSLFLTGGMISFLITAVSYVRMCKMIKSVKPVKADGTNVRIIEEEIPSFSWGRHIVIGRKDLEENPAILTHERMHVKCGHSFDLMAYTIVTTLQWFNPLVWISRTELKMLHEYEADELTINKGIDATQYQLLLVKKAVGAKRFQLANGFNHSKLKNRITMMHKNKTNKWMRLAYFLCIPALIVAMGACAQKTNAGNISNPTDLSIPADKASTDTLQSEVVPFQFVETKPGFNGGDANEFSKWVNENLVYPENCKKEGISGRVTLSFTVTETGKVTNVKVLRGVHEDLDQEALRVVSSSPDWTPGMKDGKPVAISYTFPVIFQTKKPEKDA